MTSVEGCSKSLKVKYRTSSCRLLDLYHLQETSDSLLREAADVNKSLDGMMKFYADFPSINVCVSYFKYYNRRSVRSG